MYHHNSGLARDGMEDEFKKYCRDVHDFPKEGIVFRDITNLLRNGDVFKKAVDRFTYRFMNEDIGVVCSIEARGFILGSAVAYALGAGFVPIRKKGKLPWHTHQMAYDLEYGEDELEVHIDAVSAGNRVLLVDDLIATGGTVKAAADLITHMKGKVVCAAFLIELVALAGRQKLGDVPVYSLIRY